MTTEKHALEEQHAQEVNYVLDGGAAPGASVKEQLSTWHANRGDRSVVASILPRPHKDDTATKNPFKLLREINFMGWMLFLSGWFCWTCDGWVPPSYNCL